MSPKQLQTAMAAGMHVYVWKSIWNNNRRHQSSYWNCGSQVIVVWEKFISVSAEDFHNTQFGSETRPTSYSTGTGVLPRG